ncbi:MAG: hypothetical protein KDK37_12290 [Leptospiraceae bacterium]|nr:hypothetical protein [Leptospiraceae bacterium]
MNVERNMVASGPWTGTEQFVLRFTNGNRTYEVYKFMDSGHPLICVFSFRKGAQLFAGSSSQFAPGAGMRAFSNIHDLKTHYRSFGMPEIEAILGLDYSYLKAA